MATSNFIGSSRFLSLKWKVMLLVSIAMLLFSAAFLWQLQHDLISGFEQERAAKSQRLVNELFAHQKNFAMRMQQLASMLAASTAAVEVDSTEAAREHFRQHFESTWISLQLDFGLNGMQFHDSEGVLVSQWGDMDELVETVRLKEYLRDESPHSWVECRADCLQYAIAPILQAGEVEGSMVVTAMLSDVIISMHEYSGAETGLLFFAAENEKQVQLPVLGMRVSGLFNRERNMQVLRSIERLPEMDGGIGTSRFWLADTYHELTFISMDRPYSAPEVLAVLIEDITDEYLKVRHQVLTGLTAGAIGLLLVMGLLYILLSAPLARVTAAAEAIPLLGRRAFSQLRAILKPRAGQQMADEIDHLSEAAIRLSYELEALDDEVSQHARKTKEMLDNVSKAHAFSQRLLDTVQVVILTQGLDGRVHSINHFGEDLFGWSEQELQDQNFTETLCNLPQTDEDEKKRLFQDIAAGRADNVYRECETICRDGSVRQMAWNHSRLEMDPVQILSAGIDITWRKHAEDRLLYLANHDQLTGLANRSRFVQELEQSLAMVRRSGQSCALLYLDLDGFKYINDVSGHQAGDIVLRMVAETLQTLLRDTDFLARLGGDEMGLLLYDTDRQGAIDVAEKINQQFSAMRFPGVSGNHQVSASIGIVIYSNAEMDVKELLANADVAMYQAKATGRARWHLYQQGDGAHEKLHEWVYWEDRIRKALHDDGFVMLYQPILNLKNNLVSHYEALVRMRNDDGSLILPGEFMEVAEKTALVRELDRRVIELVFEEMLKLHAAGKQYKIAINLSGVSISDASLLDFLKQRLTLHPELLPNLIFEITETAALSDFAVARNFMLAVRDLGCVFSLDDFGVGFSSFYYVKHLPVDYVKIDGSFIRALADSHDDQVFVRALAEVARGFGKLTVAEFVEDERVLALLRTYGVNYAQGYHIGKPSELID
jgi:diguanylate cyclase (GGDEF)-like protein/PAS domain S-box-containing protein